MNTDKILQYADRIEKLPHGSCSHLNEGFNMAAVMWPCGTPSCIAGWISYWETGEAKIHVATAALGLNDEQEDHLFFPPEDNLQ